MSVVISNILILYWENFFFINTKYSVIFHYLCYTQKKIIFLLIQKYSTIFYFLYYTQKKNIFKIFDIILLSLIILYSSYSLLKFSFILSYLSFSFKILINSSWLISRSINAWDINVSTLLSLLLANVRTWSCFFFLFLDIFNNFCNYSSC